MIVAMAIFALGLLVWIGLTLTRLFSVINEIRKTDACPDSAHAAFSRANIRFECELLKNTGIKAAQLQEEFNGLPEFAEAPRTGAYVPSPTVESKMSDICMEIASWWGYLRNVEFMLEANSMVQRGELTIGEARKIYDDMNTLFGMDQGHESYVMLQEWKDRMALKEVREAPTAVTIADKELAEFAEAKLAEHESRVEQLKALRMEWEYKFGKHKPSPPRTIPFSYW